MNKICFNIKVGNIFYLDSNMKIKNRSLEEKMENFKKNKKMYFIQFVKNAKKEIRFFSEMVKYSNIGEIEYISDEIIGREKLNDIILNSGDIIVILINDTIFAFAIVIKDGYILKTGKNFIDFNNIKFLGVKSFLYKNGDKFFAGKKVMIHQFNGKSYGYGIIDFNSFFLNHLFNDGISIGKMFLDILINGITNNKLVFPYKMNFFLSLLYKNYGDIVQQLINEFGKTNESMIMKLLSLLYETSIGDLDVQITKSIKNQQEFFNLIKDLETKKVSLISYPHLYDMLTKYITSNFIKSIGIYYSDTLLEKHKKYEKSFSEIIKNIDNEDNFKNTILNKEFDGIYSLSEDEIYELDIKNHIYDIMKQKYNEKDINILKVIIEDNTNSNIIKKHLGKDGLEKIKKMITEYKIIRKKILEEYKKNK